MTPPTGTSVKGMGQLPPADFYSPKSCANCHGSSSDALNSSGATFFADNPKNLPYLASPSDCSAEIFWPDSLKTYREFVQQSPFLKSQNYLQTLMASREGSFPLEVTDNSLGVYLGMKGDSSLPSIPKVPDLRTVHDATVCSGPLLPGKDGLQACQGIQIEWKNGDAYLPLEGMELVSAKDLELEAKGILSQLPGVQAKGVTVRGGKLMLGIALSNPLWNAAIPLALPFKGLQVSPNPLNPNLYDVDLTPMVLKKLPVAYHVEKRESVSYEAYQASSEKGKMKVLPYFLNIARSGRFPDRLALNQIFIALNELRANTDPAKKTEDPAQKALLEKLLDKLSVSAQLHPWRVLTKNLYVEFEQDLENNNFRTDFSIKQLKDWEVLATAPVRISRLFSPGIVDLLGLKADLGLYLHRQNTSSFSLDNLEVELGPLEYFRTDPDKPGIFALLGGRILSIEDPIKNYLLHQPAISVKGTAEGADVELNVRLDGVSLRLPKLGKVTLSGDLQGKVRLVPKIGTENLGGEIRETKTYVIEPHSLKLSLSRLDLRTESGVHWQDAELEITDENPLGIGVSDDPGYLSLRFRFPKVEGGHFKSFTIEGGLPLAKGYDGLYDLRATLANVESQFTLKALKENGLGENWTLDIKGNHSAESSLFGARLSGVQFDAAGKVVRNPIDNLAMTFSREAFENVQSYGYHLDADRLDFDHLDLSKVRVGVSIIREESKPGIIRWSVPEFGIKANGSGWSKKGWVRGPIWLTSKATAKDPFFIEIDKNAKSLEMKNLNLSFGVTGLTDAKIAKATGGRILGLDVDGRLRGHWKMNYETFKGAGLISLSGDGQGDIHLRGADGMPLSKPHPDDPTLLVGTPVLSNTEWWVRRIDGIDLDNQWINGQFHLSTLIDPAVARVFGFIFENNLVLSWKFNHDHLPYTADGFTKKIDQYLAKKDWEERSEKKKEEVKP